VCLSLSLTWGLDGYWAAVADEARAGARVVQLLHDITFVVHPQWVMPDWAAMGARWMREATEHADLLLVTSQFQRAEIERYVHAAGLRSRPIAIVRLGDDPRGLTSPTETPLRPDGPFVLCVSGFYPRKNHHALYHVWRRLAATLGERCPFLVLVGEVPRMPFELLSQIERDPLTRDRVLVWFDVSDDELGRLFRRCLFTVYPSHYEGWGLPVAESLRLGRYCIASSAASLPEVGGDLVDYVDPFDHRALFDRIAHALAHPHYVWEREAAIRARYRPHSWKDTARQILESVR
jgi:glycosyltransferase involved in cell wall biosynthesis